MAFAMRHSIAVLKVSVAAAIALTNVSVAAEPETCLTVLDTQKAERLIAVAERVGDIAEFKRQSSGLLSYFARIPDTETQAARYYCTSAIQSLRNFADDLSFPNQAAQILAAERSRRSYVEWMPKCEAALELPATQQPNLRSR